MLRFFAWLRDFISDFLATPGDPDYVPAVRGCCGECEAEHMEREAIIFAKPLTPNEIAEFRRKWREFIEGCRRDELAEISGLHVEAASPALEANSIGGGPC